MRYISPVGSHHRLAADSSRLVSGSLGCSPSLSTVAGRAHLNLPCAKTQIPLNIAVAVIRTAGDVVAGNPVLVVDTRLVHKQV
jgi:hypothetical protein